MALDYRERKTVSKNRPKSKPVGLMVFAFLLVALVSFALGVLVDRFLLPPREANNELSPTPQQGTDAAKTSSAQAQTAEGNPPVVTTPPRPTGETPLTFYETLPKGGKAILGSGINLKKDEVEISAPRNTVTPPVARDQSVATQKPPSNLSDARGRKDEPSSAAGVKGKNDGPEIKTQQSQLASAVKVTFSVQVASSKEHKEADAIRSKLAEKGFTAYVTESTIPGKGTWYRVRVGRKMDQSSASNLAEMLGKGAILIPE